MLALQKKDYVMSVKPVANGKLKKESYESIPDWWFERYVPMRKTADKNGYKIMDLCFFVKYFQIVKQFPGSMKGMAINKT